jgi:hypothetical protein
MPEKSKGKKYREEKILNSLDLQMEIYGAIAIRNPKINAFRTRENFDNLCEQIYGGSFPFVFPVWRASETDAKPWYLNLSIDLRFNKDEIMYRLKKWIDKEWANYHKTKRKHVQRRHVEKWVEYLQIWDLRRGIPPATSQQILNVLWPDEDKKGHPWTYERIAKYLNQTAAESPKELLKQIDKVKKEYRAAYRLIFGEVYNHSKTLLKVKEAQQNGFAPSRACKSCIDRGSCRELCPDMIEDIARFEIKQAHLITDKPLSSDIEKLQQSKKRPAAE